MKLDINNPQHAATLARYLSGEMEDEDRREFEKYIAGEEENSKLIQTMKKQWKSIGGYQEPEAPDAIKAWDKLHARLVEEQLIPDQRIVAGNILRGKLIRIAAVFLVVLCTGAILFWSVNTHQPKVDMVQLNTANEPNTLIKTLGDGSIIYLAQNSLFSFPREFAPGQRNVELKGEAFFDIAPNPNKPFIIETDEALIEVLGTAFNVKTQNGSNFELFVDRGKVKVTLKNNPSKSELVIAGEKITSVNNSIVKSNHSIYGFPAWYTRRMRFKDESLQNIFRVLNRNFNTTFVTANPEVGNRRLTDTFDNESEEAMTELICLSLNLKSQVTNDSIVLSANKAEAREN